MRFSTFLACLAVMAFALGLSGCNKADKTASEEKTTGGSGEKGGSKTNEDDPGHGEPGHVHKEGDDDPGHGEPGDVHKEGDDDPGHGEEGHVHSEGDDDPGHGEEGHEHGDDDPGHGEEGHEHGDADHSAHDDADEAAIAEALAELPEADRIAATAQKICPVTDEPLGEMGPPTKITFDGQDVFFCCKMCEKKFAADPDKYLAKLKN